MDVITNDCGGREDFYRFGKGKYGKLLGRLIRLGHPIRTFCFQCCRRSCTRCGSTNEKVGAKIRVARLDRVPYMLVLGAKEVEDCTVSIRHRDHEELATMTLEEFTEKITTEIRVRRL